MSRHDLTSVIFKFSKQTTEGKIKIMSEKGGNPKQDKAQVEQKQHEQCKPWQKKQHHQRPEAKKKDPEEIPIQQYGPNNNFPKFKEALSKAALKNYGNQEKLIKNRAVIILQKCQRGKITICRIMLT
jgi:hypothetical protein